MLVSALGVVVCTANALITRSVIRRIEPRINDLVSYPAAELAAWQSHYYKGANAGAPDAKGRYLVTLERTYSGDLIGLSGGLPNNLSVGTPLNLAQTAPSDLGTEVITRVPSKDFRYQPAFYANGAYQYCGHLINGGQATGYQQCLTKVAPPPLCPPGVCSESIETCLQVVASQTPTLIHNETELLAMQSVKSYALANDITLASHKQVTALDLSNFALDGKSHTIKNLASYNSTQKQLGLFRSLDCALIKDITLEGAVISITTQTGGFLAQTINNTALVNLNVPTGTIKLQQNFPLPIPGGLLSEATQSLLFNVSFGASTIDGGVAASDVTFGSSQTYVGGLIGIMKGAQNSLINVRVSGTLTQGEGTIGGIVGKMEGGNILKAQVTSNINTVRGGSIGGIAGAFNGGSISESSYTGNILSSGAWVDTANLCGPNCPSDTGNAAGISVMINNVTTQSILYPVLIEKCLVSGSISGQRKVAGIADYASAGKLFGSAAEPPITLSQSRNLATLTNSHSFSKALTADLFALVSPNHARIIISDVYGKAPLVGNSGLQLGPFTGPQPPLDTLPPLASALIFKNVFITSSTPVVNAIGGALGTGGSVYQIGWYTGHTIYGSSCFFNNSAGATVAAAERCSGLTTAQLQDINTYAGWDFDTIWTLSPGSYPKFQWEP